MFFLRINLFLTALRNQLVQENVIDRLVDAIVNLLPHILGHAGMLTLAIACHTMDRRASHRREVALQRPQDVPDRDLLRRFGRHIAALRAAYATHQLRLFETGHQLFQIVF